MKKWHQLGKKSEFQMGFERMTLCDLTGCSNHWAIKDFKVTRTTYDNHSQMMTGTYELINCTVQSH